jgi:hypothetical protein
VPQLGKGFKVKRGKEEDFKPWCWVITQSDICRFHYYRTPPTTQPLQAFPGARDLSSKVLLPHCGLQYHHGPPVTKTLREGYAVVAL